MLTARQAIAAMAQVFEDYPDRFAQCALAKNVNGEIVWVASDQAYSFCALGFIERMRYESLIDVATSERAVALLAGRPNGWSARQEVVRINNDRGRQALIDRAREVVADTSPGV